jgi:predicted glycosyl hydrolase (DUF1957 family)
MEKLDKQLLMNKFNEVLNRAEEITQWDEFKEYKAKEQELIEFSKETNEKIIKPYIDKLWDKIEFGNTLDSTALMVALAGNSCMF